ncbi:hypothetical protein ACTXT7_013465 [Hymenolepis weldensis]
MDKHTKSVNTIRLAGQTNTGKSLIANLIYGHLTHGTLYRCGTVALMGERRIMMTKKDGTKNLLGGARFEVDINYGANRFLPRIPVVATEKIRPRNQSALGGRKRFSFQTEGIS